MRDAAAAGAPNPGLVLEMMNAHQRTAVLNAAIELGVFGAVGGGAEDAASIARECRASERGMRILCDSLVIYGVLAKEDGRYRHTATSATFLDPRSPACLASIAGFLSGTQVQESCRNLAEVVRNGRTSLAGEGMVEAENPAWVSFAENMVPMMAPIAGPVAAAALEGRTGPMRVLDIAAGHGLFGIAAAKQNAEVRVTALDWTNVLQVAMRNAKAAGVEERYELLPGSAFEVEFGGGYDAVLLTNFLHHFDKATCVALLKKVHAALRPGGRAVTLEFVPNEDRVSPAPAAVFSLTMLVSTPAGDAYTFDELRKMYEEAGFKAVASRPVPMSPETIVVGEA